MSAAGTTRQLPRNAIVKMYGPLTDGQQTGDAHFCWSNRNPRFNAGHNHPFILLAVDAQVHRKRSVPRSERPLDRALGFFADVAALSNFLAGSGECGLYAQRHLAGLAIQRLGIRTIVSIRRINALL